LRGGTLCQLAAGGMHGDDCETDSAVSDLGTAGARLVPLAAGTSRWPEVDPNDATSDGSRSPPGGTLASTVLVLRCAGAPRTAGERPL